MTSCKSDARVTAEYRADNNKTARNMTVSDASRMSTAPCWLRATPVAFEGSFMPSLFMSSEYSNCVFKVTRLDTCFHLSIHTIS
jgi:hypothetical protein